MAFTSWADEYAKFKLAIAQMTPEQMIQAGYTSIDGSTITFKRLSDIMDYGERLKLLAVEETNSGNRSAFITMGFGGLG